MMSDLLPFPNTPTESSGTEAILKSLNGGTFDYPRNDVLKASFSGYIRGVIRIGSYFDVLIRMRSRRPLQWCRIYFPTRIHSRSHMCPISRQVSPPTAYVKKYHGIWIWINIIFVQPKFFQVSKYTFNRIKGLDLTNFCLKQFLVYFYQVTSSLERTAGNKASSNTASSWYKFVNEFLDRLVTFYHHDGIFQFPIVIR